MKIVTTIQEVRETVNVWRAEGLNVGFVPTMGYLHEGHQSLIHKASKENHRVVVSIFINPMQFGKNEDLDSYPRDLERDRQICFSAGADLIFYPSREEMYPEGFSTFVQITGITETLCGKSRPDHFRGVSTVVTKLFHIVKPDRAYFGQKDAQQAAVIKRLVRDLNLDIEIIACKTVREPDGLAKSSRNVYLSKEERAAAAVLRKALTLAENKLVSGERKAAEILQEMKEKICAERLATLDYVEIVDLETLEPVRCIEAPVLVAVAAYIGKTRLIDNFIYENIA